MGNKSFGEQLRSVLLAIEKGKLRNEDAIASAEEIMLDAVRHLSRPQMGQCNNQLAARMDEWLTENTG